MHELPRQKLSELLAEHGPTLCDDTRRLEGLLKDVLRNEYKRETFVLISALREGVVYELRGSTSGMPPAALAAKLTRQLCDNLGLEEAVARWGVESWDIALGAEITKTFATSINNVTQLTSTEPTPVPNPDVDLAAIALRHRENAHQEELKAEQVRLEAAQAEAIEEQRQREVNLLAAQMERKANASAVRWLDLEDFADLAAQMEKKAKANALLMHREAKQLAEQTRDFASAVRMLEGIDAQWRDAKLYETICGYRDKVAQLNEGIHNAVQNGRLNFLKRRVLELLKLQPKRDDMLRLLEVLPDEPELASEFTNSIGMKFVLIQPGEFVMGSNEAYGEKPPHKVEITEPFYLGVYPVTQAEYQAVMGTNLSLFTGNARHPVEEVSWYDAVACAQKLSQLSAELNRGLTYRLPSEVEWEYACRAGSTGKWYFGYDVSRLGEYAWFKDNYEGQTHPVGKKKPNAWGLYDMHGNVWEWCLDWYHADYYKVSPTDDPPGPSSGSCRVLRGGCCYGTAAGCRTAFRHAGDPTSRSPIYGFRLALSSVK